MIHAPSAPDSCSIRRTRSCSSPSKGAALGRGCGAGSDAAASRWWQRAILARTSRASGSSRMKASRYERALSQLPARNCASPSLR